MCGIVGLWRRRAGPELDVQERISTAVGTMRHRGPDAVGSWLDAGSGIAFGHCRLAIIDLSADANQPMQDPAGRWTLTYNGELYNYRELREELRSTWQFRTRSDTEVLLAA